MAKHVGPIAIDFGCSSVKLLQMTTGEKPGIAAAAEVPVPEEARENIDSLIEFYSRELPEVLRSSAFKGRRAVCIMPCAQTMIQHLQITPTEGVSQDELAKTQVGMQIGVAPGNLLVRTFDVRDIQRDGQTRKEIICFSMPRDIIMRYVALLEACRLQVLSMNTSTLAMVRAFDHIHNRAEDANVTTMYIDLGYSGTRVAVGHGTSLVFARAIQTGGHHFDQFIAKQRKISISEAHAYRLSMTNVQTSSRVSGTSGSNGSPLTSAAAASDTPLGTHNSAQSASTEPPAPNDEESDNQFSRLAAAMAKEQQQAGGAEPVASSAPTAPQHQSPVRTGDRRDPEKLPPTLHSAIEEPGAPADEPPDLTELLETVADELSMCARYHHSLFPKRPITRLVIVGGEARQRWLCQHVARSLGLPAVLGDPIARLLNEETLNNVGLFQPGEPKPDWAIACGLCSMQVHD